MPFKSFTLLSLLLTSSAIASDTESPKLPGTGLSTRLADEQGQYVFHNALSYNAHKGTLDDEQLAFFAKTAYEDIFGKIFSKYKDKYEDLQEPEAVALLAKDEQLYIASTLSRNSTAGAWNPLTKDDSLRDALYQCQARILTGVPDKTPANCAEAMAMHIYLASHPEAGSSVEEAKLAVCGRTGDKGTGLRESCKADPKDKVAFANAYGCKNLLRAMKVESVPADTDANGGKEHHIGDTVAQKVCL